MEDQKGSAYLWQDMPTPVLLDKYDGYLRIAEEVNAKLRIARQLRAKAGELFSDGAHDVTAFALRQQAEQIEQAADTDSCEQASVYLNEIYDEVRRRG